MTEEQEIPKQVPVESSSETVQQDSIIPQSETQLADMEVHHHPDLHHKHKRWREYLAEFVMIFLAVTLGFFAESLREKIADDKKGKEFAKSLYHDLKEDREFLKGLIDYKTWRGQKADSLISILKRGTVKEYSNLMYYYHAIISGNLPFRPKDVTIQQMRNSGSLRYLNNPRIYNAISTYYWQVNFYIERENERSVKIPVDLTAKIFQATEFLSIAKVTPKIQDAVHMPEGNPQLLTDDKQTLNEYLLYVSIDKSANDLSKLLLIELVQKSLITLIDELQKEYVLE